jgi:predicted ATP-grasp superfamily ATP-dependent carboligase
MATTKRDKNKSPNQPKPRNNQEVAIVVYNTQQVVYTSEFGQILRRHIDVSIEKNVIYYLSNNIIKWFKYLFTISYIIQISIYTFCLDHKRK